jgi:hypothetical protein
MAKYAVFQKIISILVIINLIGCTTLQPIKAQPDELQDRIRHEDLVKVFDDVKIFTEDGKEHRLRVTSIDSKKIVGVRVTSVDGKEVLGDSVTIPVDSIVGLETEEIHYGKTALAAGGIAAGAWVAFMVTVLFLLMASGY